MRWVTVEAITNNKYTTHQIKNMSIIRESSASKSQHVRSPSSFKYRAKCNHNYANLTARITSELERDTLWYKEEWHYAWRLTSQAAGRETPYAVIDCHLQLIQLRICTLSRSKYYGHINASCKSLIECTHSFALYSEFFNVGYTAWKRGPSPSHILQCAYQTRMSMILFT